MTSLTALKGSDKQIAWAEQLRGKALELIDARMAEIKELAGGDLDTRDAFLLVQFGRAKGVLVTRLRSSTWIIDRRGGLSATGIDYWVWDLLSLVAKTDQQPIATFNDWRKGRAA